MKVKEKTENVGLEFNIQKTKIMASGPITSWQIDGQTMETVRDFIFLGSKITADGGCSHEIKRDLLLDLRMDFSGGRSGGLVFPSLEFSTVCCDPHSQRFFLLHILKKKKF